MKAVGAVDQPSFLVWLAGLCHTGVLIRVFDGTEEINVFALVVETTKF